MSLSLISSFLFVCILFILGCSNEVATQYRLVDRIKDAQIDSPLELLPVTSPSDVQESSALKSDREKLKQVVEKYTNRDLTFGENTYPFALKVTLASELRSVLFAPTPSTYRFTLKIPKKASLDFGYGIMSESWEDGNTGAHFEISLIDTNAKEYALFAESINPNRIRSDRTWFDHRIDLADYANQEVILRMKTRKIESTEINPNVALSNHFDYAVWSNPILISADRKDDKLNVILISYDTLRADHLGCYGYPRNTSPNIDQFAKGAALFKNAFSTASWTIPAHGSLFTSLLPKAHGATADTSGEVREILPLADSHVTLAEILRDKGYITGAFTGGGFVAPSIGFHQGFDTYYDRRVIEDAWSQDENVWWDEEYQSGIDKIFEKAVGWLDRHRHRPFFFFFHTFEVHTPYNRHFFTQGLQSGRFTSDKFDYNKQWGEEWFLEALRTATDEEKAYIIAQYDGGIYYADGFIGKLLNQLDTMQLSKDTMIVFLSDHGEEFWDRFPQMTGQHGHSPYDELLHVPLIISHPSWQSGTVIDQQVSLIDVFPTVLEALGIPYDSRSIHGRSLVPLMTESSGHSNNGVVYSEQLFWGPCRQSVRMPPFKYIYTPNLTEIGSSYVGVDFHGVGMPVFGKMRQEELYHLVDDPMEKNNLASQNAALAKNLRKQVRDVFEIVTARWIGDSEGEHQNLSSTPDAVVIHLEGVIKPIETVDVVSRDGGKWSTKDGRLKMTSSGVGDTYLTFDDPTHTKPDIYLIHVHYGDKTTTRLTVERSVGAKGK